jgi:hypothetical protein
MNLLPTPYLQSLLAGSASKAADYAWILLVGFISFQVARAIFM